MVADPGKYLWTGHLSYLGKLKDGLIDEDFVLGQSGENRYRARQRYLQFVLEDLHTGHQEKYYEVKGQLYLGGESFIDRIEVEKRDTGNVLYDIPIEVIAEEVSRATGIARVRLYSLTRDHEGAHGRSMVAYLS